MRQNARIQKALQWMTATFTEKFTYLGLLRETGAGNTSTSLFIPWSRWCRLWIFDVTIFCFFHCSWIRLRFTRNFIHFFSEYLFKVNFMIHRSLKGSDWYNTVIAKNSCTSRLILIGKVDAKLLKSVVVDDKWIYVCGYPLDSLF